MAFGTPLTYGGYRAVEDCAGVPLHTSLRTALTRVRVDDVLAWILVRETRVGSRSEKWLDELGRYLVPATAPLDTLVNTVAARQLRPAHGPIVLDFALRYLMKFSERRPDAMLASHGYLASVCQYVFRDNHDAQVSYLKWVLEIAFGAPLSRTAIDAVCARPLTKALYKAVLDMTDRRDRAYVEEQVTAAARRSQGLPGRPVPVRERGRWMPRLPRGRQWRGGREPMSEQSSSSSPPSTGSSSGSLEPSAPAGGRPATPAGQAAGSAPSTASVWEYPKLALGSIAVILVVCLIAYLMLQAMLG